MAIDETAFERLLDWLDPNRGKAGKIYKDIHTRLTKFFECRRCYHAEVCADETMDRIGKKLKAGQQIKADNKYLYCLGVARNVQKECWKIKPHCSLEDLLLQQQLLKESEEPDQEETEKQLHEQKIKCQKECFENLPSDDRLLMILYVQGKKREREKLAKQYELVISALTLRVFRIRERLRACQKKCLERYKKYRNFFCFIPYYMDGG